MYTLVSAIGKLKSDSKKWITVDLSSIQLKDVFINYKQVLATIEDEFMTEPEVFDLEYLEPLHSLSEETFTEFLVTNGNNALPTTPGGLEVITSIARYADAFRAGYTITPVTQGGHSGGNEPREDKTWLMLEKDDLDYSLFEKHCLVSINGYFHFVETNNQGIYIKDGMKSNLYCGYNTCGIVSFKGISELKCKPITLDMIQQQGDAPLSDRIIIDFQEDITNKTVMLVVGGYLIRPDSKIFSRNAENSVVFDYTNYSIFNRFYESLQFLDYSDLDFEFEIPPNNEDQRVLAEFYNEDFIKAYFTMSQSFVVILDNPDIYFDEDHVRVSPMPGIYTSYKKPLWPMFVGQGMFANYWYTFQKPLWSINTIYGLRYRYQYNTTATKNLLTLDNSREPNNPINWSRAFYLHMKVDQLKDFM